MNERGFLDPNSIYGIVEKPFGYFCCCLMINSVIFEPGKRVPESKDIAIPAKKKV